MRRTLITQIKLLIVILLIAMFPQIVTKASNNFEYSNSANTIITRIPNEERIVVPEGVLEISDKVYENNEKLTAVKYLSIPSTLEWIGEEDAITELFPNLKELHIATGNRTFSYSKGIVYRLNANGEEYKVVAVLNDKINSDVVLPNTVKYIKSYAFYGCSKMSTLTFSKEFSAFSASGGEDLYYVNGAEFKGCDNLVAFKVANGNQTYRAIDGAIYSKDMRTLYAVPKGIEGTYSVRTGTMRITYQAFYGCDKLKCVKIPHGVTRISGKAFEKCIRLETVKFLSKIAPNIDGEIIEDCDNLKKFYVPKGCKNAYKKKFDIDEQKFVKEGKYRAINKKTNRLERAKLEAFSNGNEVTLSWNEVLYAEGYKIQKKTGNSWKTISVIKNPTKTRYSKKGDKTGMDEGREYTFRVIAYSDSLQRASNSVKALRISTRKVSVEKQGHRSILVKWNATKELTGYKIKIYEKDGSYNKTFFIQGGNKKQKVIQGLKKGKKYFVQVSAFRRTKKGKYSSGMSISKAITLI